MSKSKVSFQGKSYAFPFMLDQGVSKGCLVRLGAEFTEITKMHGYPECVNNILGELLALGAALVLDSKINSVMTLQITQGAIISMVVAEISSDGAIRGCATFNKDELNAFLKNNLTPSFKDLFKNGQFVLTTRFDNSNELHQAIVEIAGDTLAESLQHYFEQSVQIQTQIKVASHFVFDSEIVNNEVPSKIVDITTGSSVENRLPFSVGALFLQKLPSHISALDAEKNDNTFRDHEKLEDAWTAHKALSATVTSEELLSSQISADILLHRLFNQHEIIVYPPKGMNAKCSCSKERLHAVLQNFERTALEEMQTNGKITADCNFCGSIYDFSLNDFQN